MKKYNTYSLNISDKFNEYSLIKKEMKNIYQMMKRYKNINRKYEDISFIIGISNTSSKDAKVSYIYNKSRGKPRKTIVGTKTLWHFHIYIIGNECSSASSFCNMLRRIITTKKGYITSQNKNDDVDIAIEYVKKQCISYWIYGPYFESNK